MLAAMAANRASRDELNLSPAQRNQLLTRMYHDSSTVERSKSLLKIDFYDSS
jgi:hypothetical protein